MYTGSTPDLHPKYSPSQETARASPGTYPEPDKFSAHKPPGGADTIWKSPHLSGHVAILPGEIRISYAPESEERDIPTHSSPHHDQGV